MCLSVLLFEIGVSYICIGQMSPRHFLPSPRLEKKRAGAPSRCTATPLPSCPRVGCPVDSVTSLREQALLERGLALHTWHSKR